MFETGAQYREDMELDVELGLVTRDEARGVRWGGQSGP